MDGETVKYHIIYHFGCGRPHPKCDRAMRLTFKIYATDQFFLPSAHTI